MKQLVLKRVYDVPSKDDGTRILIDRLWPRGLTKEKAKIDVWLKDIAPSSDLRKWFGHDPKKWDDFRKKYFAELQENKTAVASLKVVLKKGNATLVFGAKDTDHNDAVVLLEFLKINK